MKINQDTLNAIVNYLVTRPYNEVANLIGLLQNDIQTLTDEPIEEVDE